MNILDRGSQVHEMAGFEELLDFPPSPKLNVEGKFDPRKASANELRGRRTFAGKGRCAGCHAGAYYRDNSCKTCKPRRTYTPRMVKWQDGLR